MAIASSKVWAIAMPDRTKKLKAKIWDKPEIDQSFTRIDGGFLDNLLGRTRNPDPNGNAAKYKDCAERQRSLHRFCGIELA